MYVLEKKLMSAEINFLSVMFRYNLYQHQSTSSFKLKFHISKRTLCYTS